jgi:hypothetical protein
MQIVRTDHKTKQASVIVTESITLTDYMLGGPHKAELDSQEASTYGKVRKIRFHIKMESVLKDKAAQNTETMRDLLFKSHVKNTSKEE